QDFVTDLDNLIVTTTPSSSTPDSTTILEEPTSHPLEDVTLSALADAEDPSTSSSPLGSKELSELEPVTAHVPSYTAAAQDDTTHGVTADDLLADTLKPTSTQKPEPTTVSLDKPDPYKLDPAKPPSKPETKPLETLNIDDSEIICFFISQVISSQMCLFSPDDSNDTNLCSGRPVSGVTTLSNGTMVVFRGHYFWLLDRNRVPSPPRGITQVWGVPSPIDTVFTRCNCQGKTYIFKGNQYWRFENDALDPGYPNVITTGFDGLRGHITAALSVPQYKTRSESVYFFKRGGLVQKYSYQAGTSPTCGRKPHYAIYTVRNRVTRQAAPGLGPAINIRTSWRGFPSTITAAVSVPSVRDPEGYKYYVFSRGKMDGERPAIAAPTANASPQTNNFFRCPKKI
uniref:Proteoglycan 4b n=1 Tax=Amphilophus citrinellus TaxID=61819 RepID=A0A3Q0S4I1_AMPCI